MRKTLIITAYVAFTAFSALASAAPASAQGNVGNFNSNVGGNFNTNGLDTTRFQQLTCQIRPQACRGQNGPHPSQQPGTQRNPNPPQGARRH